MRRTLAALILLCGTLSAADTVYPRAGVVAGGTTVVIVRSGGGDFAGATGVTFNGVAGTGFSLGAGDTEITVVAPAAAGGNPASVNLVINDTAGPTTLTAAYTYLETAQTSVQIDVTVTLTQTLGICWAGVAPAQTNVNGSNITEGDTSTITWALGNLATSASRSSVAGGGATQNDEFFVRNVGDGACQITASCVDSANWTRGDTIGLNRFVMSVSTNDGVGWTSLSASRQLNAALAVGGTQEFDLKFDAPSATTSFNVAQSIAVTITAAP